VHENRPSSGNSPCHQYVYTEVLHHIDIFTNGCSSSLCNLDLSHLQKRIRPAPPRYARAAFRSRVFLQPCVFGICLDWFIHADLGKCKGGFVSSTRKTIKRRHRKHHQILETPSILQVCSECLQVTFHIGPDLTVLLEENQGTPFPAL
jgi:hypothetical protein